MFGGAGCSTGHRSPEARARKGNPQRIQAIASSAVAWALEALAAASLAVRQQNMARMTRYLSCLRFTVGTPLVLQYRDDVTKKHGLELGGEPRWLFEQLSALGTIDSALQRSARQGAVLRRSRRGRFALTVAVDNLHYPWTSIRVVSSDEPIPLPSGPPVVVAVATDELHELLKDVAFFAAPMPSCMRERRTEQCYLFRVPRRSVCRRAGCCRPLGVEVPLAANSSRTLIPFSSQPWALRIQR